VHLPRVRALVERRGEVTLARRILSSTETTNWDSLETQGDREKYLAVRCEDLGA
jgi:phosphopantetheinyl transferase (holo-ACP synthase)